ncbi:hypothetical protein GCM10010275_29900 [Streptomyces litmocidini]|uniref:carbohydrate binding domain-containing protein n=1 Tax=Streptomyces litmocidini TaxID=67318 RepID=UPI00167D5D91|nr:carbohydrate binding domain-containing protein [Streptomyces litmocidini]GGU90929.1 hypothetical protein GCM10010275_29900 [Streptomyces litmocidini]
MSRVTVQCGFGYSPIASDIAWTDITRYIALSDSEGISIGRGAGDELSDTQTGTLSVAVDNSDGRFTPGNASSPYYPNVRRNAPIRVITTVLGGINFLTQPGFETNDGSWTAVAGAAPASVGLDAAHVKSGTNALKIAWATAGTGGVVACQLYGLTVGVSYTASVYVWVPAGDPAVRLDVDGTTVGAASTLTGTFQRISVTWTTTAASHLLRITTTTTSPSAGDFVWMDEAQVEQGSTPTAWSSTPATHHTRFYGMATSWPMSWEGLYSQAQITASDMLKWTSRRPALGPMLVEEIQSDGAQLYYPLSEPESSATAGDQSGYSRPSMTIGQSGAGGTLTFAAGVGASSDGLGAPLFAPASATDGKYLRCSVSPLLTSSGATGTPIPGTQIYECWFNTGTSGRTIMTWSSGATPAFDSGIRFLLESGTGKLQVTEFFSVGPTTYTLATPNLADSTIHQLVWDEAAQKVWVDGVQYSVATSTWQDRLVLTIGATETGTSLWVGTISHVAAYVVNGAGPATADIVDHYGVGTTGKSGETADARMTRLASYVKIPGVVTSGTFSTVASQGELGASPLSHMRDVERTEGGKLFADRASAQLVFQARTVRYNPASTVTLAYSDLETPGVEFSDDDQKLINLITASRPGGATQRIQDADSISLYGVYEEQLDVLKTSDSAVIDAATWAIIRYADPLPEMRQLPVEASTLGVTTYRALLDADISSVMTVTTLPSQAMASTVTVTAEGYTERILQNRHFLDFHVSRSDTDSVWVLDDSTYSVLGSTTRLAY